MPALRSVDPQVAVDVLAHCQALPADTDIDALLLRTRFYRASNALRIARNKPVSPSDRMALVARSLALLNAW